MDSLSKRKKSTNLSLLFSSLLILYALLEIVIGFLTAKGVSIPTNVLLLLGEAIFLIPALVLIIKNRLTLSDLGIRKLKIGSVLLSILLGFLVIPIGSSINLLTQFVVSNTITQASEVLLEGNVFVLLFVSGIFAPICEELIFRCILHRRYALISSVFSSAFISALLFGWMHLNFNQTCYAFVLGLLFALANHVSGSCITSIIMHITLNTFNMLALTISNEFYKASGSETSVSAVAEELRSNTSYLLFITLIYLVLAIVCFFLFVLFLYIIALVENRSAEFSALLPKKAKKNSQDMEEEPASETDMLKLHQLFLNVPMLLSIALTLLILLGANPIVSFLSKLF